MITPQAAKSLAIWLAMVHPDIFNRIVNQPSLVKGMGDWSDVTAVQDISVTAPSLDSVSAALQSVPTTTEAAALPGNSDSTSSWFSSVGSDVGAAISSVGSWLTTGGGLNTLANVGTAYFKAQASTNQAAAQNQILQTQIARAQSGQTAAPITYVRNPVTGALQAAYVAQTNSLPPSMIAGNTPLVSSASGYTAYPLTQSGLAQLTPTGVEQFLQKYGLWIGAGVLGLLLVSRMRST